MLAAVGVAVQAEGRAGRREGLQHAVGHRLEPPVDALCRLDGEAPDGAGRDRAGHQVDGVVERVHVGRRRGHALALESLDEHGRPEVPEGEMEEGRRHRPPVADGPLEVAVAQPADEGAETLALTLVLGEERARGCH